MGFTWPRPRVEFVRHTAHNLQEYVSLVADHLDSHSCFVQVYSKRQARLGLIDKVFVDIDLEGASLEDTWKAWQRFLDHLDTLQYRRRSLFSAGQGFHVFMDCEPVEVSWPSLREFHKGLGRVSGVNLDTTVMGDRNRLCRVPLTPNAKSAKDGHLRWCVPIEEDWDLDHIIEASLRKTDPPTQHAVPCGRLRADLSALPSRVPRVPTKGSRATGGAQKPRERHPALKADYAHIVDLIEQVTPHVKDGRHRIMHYLLIPALVHLGETNRNILQRCRDFIEGTGKVWENYEQYAKDSILRTRQGDWSPWSLDVFRERFPRLLPGDG